MTMIILKRVALIIIISLAAVLVGCKSTGHIKPGSAAKISIGMTKAEVIKAIGQPAGVSADGHSEILSYTVENPWWQWKPLTVKIVAGKVEFLPNGVISDEIR